MNQPNAEDDVRRKLGIGKPRSRRIVRWGIGVVVLGLLASGAVFYAQQRAADRLPHYLTEPIRRADVRVTVTATGRLQGLNTVEVGAEVTGKVLRVLVTYNDRVTKGQVLAEIDAEQLQASVEEARAQVRSSDASIRTAEATALETKLARERAEEQARQGLIAQRDLEAAQAAATRAEASVTSAKASTTLARASLRSAESRLGKTQIFAPIDGIVLTREVEPGQTVTAGFQTPVLFRLAEDLTKLSLHVDVDEADVGRVKEENAATFTVDAYPERSFPSKVLALRNEPKTSQSVVTYEAVLDVDNTDRLLRPGMTATATIVSELVPGVRVVPNAALRFVPPPLPGVPPALPPQPNAKRVFVLRDGVPTLVEVRVGATDGHVTQLISEAPSDSEEVVIDAVVRR